VARLVAGKVLVTPASEPDTYTLTASQYVGTVVLPDLELLIRPKVPIENLFLLLDVGLPPAAWRPEVFAYRTDRNLLAALGAFFARTLERTIGRGLIRSYRVERERLIAVRGRVDIGTQVRRPGAITPIACVFDEYTADIDENRYLKASVQRLLRVAGVPAATRRLLQRELTRFEEVGDLISDVELPTRMVFTRLNRHYEPALRLARLVLLNLGLVDLRGKPEGTAANAFLLDMNDLFQRFLADRLRRELRGRLDVIDEPSKKLGTHGEIDMRPDLVFRYDDRDVYVGDAKYKLTDTGQGRTGDYYQLLAYTTAMDLPEGVLVYCQSTGAVPPRHVMVRNSGKRLSTYPISLHGSAAAIDETMRRLADWIVERSAPSDRANTV
jgi:5-methylcytosine-specific restriction enzyme subunit McrC